MKIKKGDTVEVITGDNKGKRGEVVRTMQKDGKLVVKGSFPTEPSRLLFELEFIPSDGEWKLIRIHVKLGSKS